MGIHTQPSDAYNEINALVDVYEEAVKHFGNQNGIILGDFNADCSYLSRSKEGKLSLKNDSRFNWLIESDIDTTISSSDCAYDRYVS